MERARASYDSGDDFAVSAFDRKTGRFVLGTGLHPRNWDVPKFEIGYWCRSSLQRQGFATEAVRALTAAAFLEMAAERVEIRCDPRNIRSRRVAELAGYRLEAELRADERANDGSLRNTVVYIQLAHEFRTAE